MGCYQQIKFLLYLVQGYPQGDCPRNGACEMGDRQKGYHNDAHQEGSCHKMIVVVLIRHSGHYNDSFNKPSIVFNAVMYFAVIDQTCIVNFYLGAMVTALFYVP